MAYARILVSSPKRKIRNRIDWQKEKKIRLL